MRNSLALALLAAFLFSQSSSLRAEEAPPFEIRDGDRVLLLGDTLLERENTYGYLETRMHEQFPTRKFTVRNLSWAGETPLGWSRASFDPPAKGFELLKEQIAMVKPTVVFLGFGMAASLQEMTDRAQDPTLNADPVRYGAEPMSAARFKKEMAQLMDAIVAISAKDQPAATTTPAATTERSAAPPAKIEERAKPPGVPANEAEAKAPADAAGAPKTGAPPAEVKIAAAPAGVRFVLFSPIRHEDLRKLRPGLPDPAAHNALLEQYSKVLEELASERSARFVSLMSVVDAAEKTIAARAKAPNYPTAPTDNGIHLNNAGYAQVGVTVPTQLGWVHRGGFSARHYEVVSAAVLRKNELFFHRFRPENATYLFGFRKHEQGQNAKEIVAFDPLIEKAEAEIDRLKRGGAPMNGRPEAANPQSAGVNSKPVVTNSGSEAVKSPSELTNAQAGVTKSKADLANPKPRLTDAKTDLTHSKGELTNSKPAGTAAPSRLPDFTVADGYQIALWAENPLLEKPTHVNWDAQGRLWVASSNTYPQVNPEDLAGYIAARAAAAAPVAGNVPGVGPSIGDDKIIILEDTDRDGVADKSTVFADGLLIPTGVVPDIADWRLPIADLKNPGAASPQSPIANQQSAMRPSACYVGQSTELLYLRDSDGDGRADERRVVFSGFGTEDTHHLIHTLRWGPDGRLYFNQSIYIHSHLETPWGMVRLNSGGVFAYDPRTERVEVLFKGFCNPWGHAWDQWGQSFLTDGAGFQGITWGIPGAQYFTYENGRRILESISPGNYPKFCGLELIHSPAFPDDWQGNAITCDFRAHRIVRFGIEDLSLAKENPKSGYVTKEMPDLVRTSDQSFRPIDVRLGPDGALYIADWSNPVINHGEVDFRDPRRDKFMGRIWRISKKDAPAVSWEPLVEKKTEELLKSVLAKNAWEQQQAQRVVMRRFELAQSYNVAGGAMKKEDASALWKTMKDWKAGLRDDAERLAGERLFNGTGNYDAGTLVSLSKSPLAEVRTNAARMAGRSVPGALQNQEEVNRPEAGQKIAPEVREDAVQMAKIYLESLVGVLTETLEQGVTDESPRVRVETMRALARNPTARSAELVLNAALGTSSPEAPGSARAPRAGSGAAAGNATASGAARAGNESPARALRGVPKDDPYYNYAAWLSINELAKPWTDAIASGAWKADTAERAAQLAWGLKAIDPGLASTTLASLVSKGQVPLDGSGAWIELLGTSGAPKELRALYDRVAAGQLTGDAELRALRALAEAARLRNVRPEGDLKGAMQAFASPKETSPARQAAGVRLLGAWKIGEAQEFIVNAAGNPQSTPELRGAAFEALRNLGGSAAAALTALTAPERALDIRRGAVVALAQLDLGAGVAQAGAILSAISDENAALETWRGLLNVKGAGDALAAKVPQDLPKVAAAAGVRAAREAGKNGTKLLAALTPLAGLAEGDAKMPKDHKGFAAIVQRDGDPAAGELVYRRMSLGCTTCHAIGGAGGVAGPDMTSLGASAPLDYIIESVLEPAVKVKEGYNAVTFTLKDGAQATGVVARETAQELFVRNAAGQEQALAKEQITARVSIGSLMPAGLVEQLKDRERVDLFAFLGALGKPGPYDASKGQVARVWRLFSGNDEAKALKGEVALESGFAGYTLVDGRFTKELLTPLVPIAAQGSETLLAVARFQSTGKTRLKLTGAAKAWLDGQPLALGADLAPELKEGIHTLAVQINVKQLPEVLRAESPDARFLGN